MRQKKASPAPFVKFVHQNRRGSAAVLAPRLWVVSRALTVGTVRHVQSVGKREALQTPLN